MPQVLSFNRRVKIFQRQLESDRALYAQSHRPLGQGPMAALMQMGFGGGPGLNIEVRRTSVVEDSIASWGGTAAANSLKGRLQVGYVI
jgi:hypothetical protein